MASVTFLFHQILTYCYTELKPLHTMNGLVLKISQALFIVLLTKSVFNHDEQL